MRKDVAGQTMEQPHDTIESQQSLKKQGLLGTGIVMVCLAAWLAYAFANPVEHGDDHGGHGATEAHGQVDHAEEHGEHTAENAEEHDDHGHEDEHAEDHAESHTDEHAAEAHTAAEEHSGDQRRDPEPLVDPVVVPAWYSVLPFAALLLAIAVLPLTHRTEHWWENNINRFKVAAGLGVLTLAYYAFLFGHGVHDHVSHGVSAPGLPAALTVLTNALLAEYIPFITLLFSLYAISGGIVIEGRLAGRPYVNTAIIGIGAALASFVGTTGAAMLLIRPLLTANVRRQYVAHTVIFFIFAVCNTGGCLLPIGDPPLFLGFLRGVDFFWTLQLWPQWLFVNLVILAVYFVYDTIVARKEDEAAFAPLKESGPLVQMEGKLNLFWLAGIIFCVATLDPSKPFPGTEWHAPLYFREFLMFALTFCSLAATPSAIRLKNTFSYDAILEVAALFSGIFICMQAPVQILNAYGDQLGFDTTTEFFWGTGLLSSFLDNAPTYVVFFETARTMASEGPTVAGVAEGFLVAISLGAVFMGAMTYIGNGPNFMVKAIAEKNNIRMPSFFGYMLYSFTVLVPIFLIMTLIFL
ncbi:MAG: sodium:proton antiporter [Rubinisphaera brasiliensis]|nr:sodium:proton antiporter [Rubinisphaera brasiliensis]